MYMCVYIYIIYMMQTPSEKNQLSQIYLNRNICMSYCASILFEKF